MEEVLVISFLPSPFSYRFSPYRRILLKPSSIINGSEDRKVFGSSSSQFASTMKKQKRNPLDLGMGNFPATKPQGPYMSFCPGDEPKILRHGRKMEAERFRHDYIYGRSMDRKTCISSCDGDSWLDRSSGIVWVGVHGTDSVCVVTRTGDLDIKRVRDRWTKHTIESFLHHFRGSLIAEIEDLADPSSIGYPFFPDAPNKLRQSVGQSIKKPFGIVSVGTDEVHEETEASNDEYERKRERNWEQCREMLQRIGKFDHHFDTPQKIKPHSLQAPAGAAQRDEKNTIKYLQEKLGSDSTFTINEIVQALEYDAEKAIKHLREKMESDVAFTMDKTIQAAISAFQHLFQKKFKANEIGVTVMDPNYIVSEDEAKYKDIYFKELEIHDIEKHLAVINEPGSGGGKHSSHLP